MPIVAVGEGSRVSREEVCVGKREGELWVGEGREESLHTNVAVNLDPFMILCILLFLYCGEPRISWILSQQHVFPSFELVRDTHRSKRLRKSSLQVQLRGVLRCAACTVLQGSVSVCAVMN